MLRVALQQVIITTENVDVGTVDNQENVEPDNRKDPARFAFFRQILQNFMAILMTALITTLMTTLTLSRMTDLELKRRNRRESNQIQKTQEGMVSTNIIKSLTSWAFFAKIFFSSKWGFGSVIALIVLRWVSTQLSCEERRRSTTTATRRTRPRWTLCLSLHLFLCLLRILKLW